MASAPAAPPDDPARVLLVLDAQHAYLADPPLGVPAARTVSANILRVLEHARAQAPPPRIVHVRNAGESGEADEPHTPGWQLVFAPRPHEPVLDKTKNNAFEGTRLAELVPPDADLVVIGIQSDFCVRATCSAALARGNNVVLVRGAHGTYDRNETWAGGTVTPAKQVEEEIEAELEEAGVVLLEMHELSELFAAR
ncbi:Isochorismatase hydrolase [Obba rivulosa]|uniref:Isochorismatase hydrolase n=1 Tax=Obba rivulosa TaxID=1052685 RepID=A0A8E2ASJ3_9APHY|nr:Isochorismatase hydrolase [Obba rivulosa]